MTRRVGQLLVAMSAAALCACGQIQDGPKPDEGLFAPVLNPITPVNMSLRKLPPPSRKSWSQCTTTRTRRGSSSRARRFRPVEGRHPGRHLRLIKALQDAGNGSWFTVVEREKLENLLKERRIIAEMRKTYLGEKTSIRKRFRRSCSRAFCSKGASSAIDSNRRPAASARAARHRRRHQIRLDTRHHLPARREHQERPGAGQCRDPQDDGA